MALRYGGLALAFGALTCGSGGGAEAYMLAPRPVKSGGLFGLPSAKPRVSLGPGPAGLHTPARTGATAPLAAQTRFVERVRESLDQPQPRVVAAVDKAGGRVTAADVAGVAGVDLAEAKRSLTSLATLTGGNLEVGKDGDLIYDFGRNVESSLAQASRVAAASRTIRNQIWPVLFYLIRVGFGVSLVASIVLLYAAIFAIQSQASDREDRERSSSGPSFYFGPSIFDIFFWRPYYGYYYSPAYRFSSTGVPPRPELGFFESIFSFVFGDGNPNTGIEREQLRLCAKRIRENGGAVTAEQLAPYLEVPLEYVRYANDALSDDANAPIPTNVDESFMLPVLTALRGEAVVTEDGDIVYLFPELTATTEEAAKSESSDMSFSGVSPSQRRLVDRASIPELMELGYQLGVNVNRITEEETLRFEILSALNDRSVENGRSGFPNPFSRQRQIRTEAKVDAIQERELEFSAAGGGQKVLAGALTGANLFGVLYLSGLVAQIPAGVAVPPVVAAASGLLPFLFPYAIALNAIPIFRWLRNKKANGDIRERNSARVRMASVLKNMGSKMSPLRRKMTAARMEASQRDIGNKVLKAGDSTYSTMESLENQASKKDPFLEFDRRLQDLNAAK